MRQKVMKGLKIKIAGVINGSLTMLIVGSFVIGGCRLRNDSQLTNYLKQRAAGEFNGDDWELKYAFIDPTVESANDQDFVFILLPERPRSRCPKSDGWLKDSRMIMLSAPMKRKESRLHSKSSQQVLFRSQGKGKSSLKMATTGKVAITKITKDFVYGRVVARYDDDYWLNGYFKAVPCKFADFE